jgi:hypothetical protein
MPLIRSVRTNVRELLADLLSDFAWPVLCALIATHVTSILFIMCLLRCARMTLAKSGLGAARLAEDAGASEATPRASEATRVEVPRVAGAAASSAV